MGVEKEFSTDEKERILLLYSRGYSAERIEKEIHADHARIRKFLRKEGVLRKKGSPHKRTHFFDLRKFREIDTKEKAYWLGFLFADGSVHKSGRAVALCLGVRDIEHLRKFAEFMDYHPGPKIYSRKSVAHVVLYSVELVKDVKQHGLVPQKTYTMEVPEIGADFMRPFIAGYFDGDGCYTSNYIVFSSHGREFLRGISREISNWGLPPNKPAYTDAGQCMTYRLRYCGGTAKRLGEELYDEELVLGRKWERLMS